MKETILGLLNSPIGYAIVGFIILFVINKIFDAKPQYAKYEGWIISAIKMAEKAIKDEVENAGLKKADQALQYFIKAYTDAKGKAPSRRLMNEVKNGIPVIHDKLEHMMQNKQRTKEIMAKDLAS